MHFGEIRLFLFLILRGQSYTNGIRNNRDAKLEESSPVDRQIRHDSLHPSSSQFIHPRMPRTSPAFLPFINLLLLPHMQRMGNEKRFGVLLTAPDNAYVEKKHGRYFDLFMRLLREEGETWDMFRVVDGDFPAAEELHEYAGFVVTGSRFDAHGNDAWILKLCHLLRTLHAMRVKVLGICFGHQILCRALGGKTGRALNGWDIGLRKVKTSETLSTRYSNFKIPSTINVLKCHQDQVHKVPLGAEVLASSESTRIEIFGLGDHILGIQGHPEYMDDILFNLCDILSDKKIVEEKTLEEARASMANNQADYEIWEKICKLFLKA